jgi:broad specificity phosphatase PhoE
MAAALGPRGPLPILVSPMRRTRETAAPLERLWGPGMVEPAVSEVPSPATDLAQRRAWLTALMGRRWRPDDDLADWRSALLSRLTAVREDTVVVSHHIALNVAVSAATGDDRVICFHPDHCSISEFETDGQTLRLLALGRQATTEIR